MRKLVAFAAAAALVVIAVVLGLLVADVRAHDAALARDDALYSATPASAVWTGSSLLPSAVADRLLGIDDDLAARRALQRYRATARRRSRLDNATEVAAERAATEAALAAVARSRDAAKSAQALTLLGILAFTDFAGAGGNGGGQADAAIAYFDAAVRTDPTSEVAKYDLELALQALTARGVRVSPGSGGASGSTGRKGGGGGVPGQGY